MIVVDVQALQSPAYMRRGVGRYVADLVVTLETEHPRLVDAYAWNDRLAGGPTLAGLDTGLALGARLRSFSELRGSDVEVLHVPAPFSPLQRADDEARAVGEVEAQRRLGLGDFRTAVRAFAPDPGVGRQIEGAPHQRAGHRSSEQEHAAIDLAAVAMVAVLFRTRERRSRPRHDRFTGEHVIDMRVPDAHLIAAGA